MLCDVLWSDPEPGLKGWGENDRGVSFTFGADVVGKFLARHDLDLVCRAHQVVEDGYEFFADRQLVTVFSAPNYCKPCMTEISLQFRCAHDPISMRAGGEFDNAGAMMSVDENLMCSFQVLKPVAKERGGRPNTPRK